VEVTAGGPDPRARETVSRQSVRSWGPPLHTARGTWRFLASLHLQIARQLLEVQRVMRQRVWEAAHVRLTAVTLDTDTTVHTLFGPQMGTRKGYNPKNKG